VSRGRRKNQERLDDVALQEERPKFWAPRRSIVARSGRPDLIERATRQRRLQ
jgi:hypothetical protein